MEPVSLLSLQLSVLFEISIQLTTLYGKLFSLIANILEFAYILDFFFKGELALLGACLMRFTKLPNISTMIDLFLHT